jgi:hypothetical protein
MAPTTQDHPEHRVWEGLSAKLKGQPALKAWADSNMTGVYALIREALGRRDSGVFDPFLPLFLKPLLLAYGIEFQATPTLQDMYPFIPNPPNFPRGGKPFKGLILGEHEWRIIGTEKQGKYTGDLTADIKTIVGAMSDLVEIKGKLSETEAAQAARELGLLCGRTGRMGPPHNNPLFNLFMWESPCVKNKTGEQTLVVLKSFTAALTEIHSRRGVPGLTKERDPTLRSYAEFLAYVEA